jgi:hypothetical protein
MPLTGPFSVETVTGLAAATATELAIAAQTVTMPTKSLGTRLNDLSHGLEGCFVFTLLPSAKAFPRSLAFASRWVDAVPGKSFLDQSQDRIMVAHRMRYVYTL